MGNGTFYSINHVLKFQNASYNYNDVSPANGFYEFVIDSTLTNDSSYYRTLYNSLRFEIHEPTKGSMPGMIFSLDHEWNRYAHKIYLHRPLDDTIFQLSTPFENNISNYQADTTEQGIVYENMITNNITNFGLSAAIYKNNGQNIRWKIFGQYFLLGYKKGNYHFGSDLKTLFSDESFLKLVLKARNEQPGFFYENFSSNHFIWKNNFSNEKYYTVALNYFNERWSFNTGISFSLINDKVYFNTSAVPAQYKNPITLYVLDVKKDFVLWKFHLDNKVAFQYIDETHEQILSLPKLALHNSTYFEQEVNFWTGGKLRFQIGFDLYYHTSFFVHAYMPVTNSFYLQKEKEIGNYPFVDAFANVAIKRFRIFAKFAHANAGFTGYDYFTALHYPAGWRMFKLGLSWRFYD
ncbi:MAG: putative porin [bacterium]